MRKYLLSGALLLLLAIAVFFSEYYLTSEVSTPEESISPSHKLAHIPHANEFWALESVIKETKKRPTHASIFTKQIGWKTASSKTNTGHLLKDYTPQKGKLHCYDKASEG